MKLPLCCALLSLLSLTLHAADRTRIDDDWKFTLGDPADAASPSLDDSGWRTVTLPHDWSIEGRIEPKAPTGGGGGFFPSGIGWYRDHIDAPAAWKGKTVEVEFEGVYMDADVYLNGQKLAGHPYGYTSFFVDLTPSLKPGAPNVLAIRVDNSHQKNSRWYSGSGIYRHVWLSVADPVHVAPWGVFVSTSKASTDSATLVIQTHLLNQSGAAKSATIQTIVTGPDGKELARKEASVQLSASGAGDNSAEVDVASPPLWSPENPQLSTATTTISVDGVAVDKVTTPFGIRTLAWSAANGLTLNGRTYKLSGGCIHHDNGVLGACAFYRAEERKIQILKAAGFNAIRTAHNPPSPALLDACDRLGMLVMDEAFDCWVNGKNSQDYHIYFKDWWQRDLASMVERDRNHPSVVLWSVGNEIPGIYTEMGATYEPQMVSLIHSLDTTRPVTNGILGWPVNPNKPGPNDAQNQKNAEIVWNSLDIVGSNYALDHHISQHAQFPDRILVSTESSPPIGKAYEVENNAYAVGDFVWSAQDYLGECGVGRWFYAGDPTEPLNPPRPGDAPGKISPVMHGSDSLFPWHGAMCGDVDLIGNERPAGHLRNILWKMGDKIAIGVRQPADGKKIIVVGWGWYPAWKSWTWPGMEGKQMEVEVYSSEPAVSLSLNGKSLGVQKIQDGKTLFNVPYAPGELVASGTESGGSAPSDRVVTAGAPVAIRLIPDRTTIHADAQDLSFVRVEVVDAQKHTQPNADQQISFEVTGPATIAGLGNADLDNTDPYQGKTCRVFHGRALVVLRSTHQPGQIILNASADGLKQGEALLRTE